MKTYLYTFSLFVTVALSLTGCRSTITNLTSEEVPQNPSGIYALRMKPDIPQEKAVPGSYRAEVVIDGQAHLMEREAPEGNIYVYDYVIPQGRSQAKYYYQVNYQVILNQSIQDRQLKSELYRLDLINRYVISLESDRGPVGSRISAVGRGFTRSDKVNIGGVPAQTEYVSPHTLTFIVPPLPAGQVYDVVLTSSIGAITMGKFRVDQSSLQVTPTEVKIATGEVVLLVFGVPYPASEGGIPVEVTTDIPDSVIMSEVVIPAGARTVSVPLEGGLPGEGKLYVEAPGFSTETVSVVVDEESS